MKTIQLFQNISTIVVITIGMMLLVEYGSYLAVSYVKDEEETANQKVAYGAANFGEEQKNYMTEYRGTANIPYKSYIGWQSTEFHGKYINVNSGGLRITGYENKNPGGRTVHFFGNSSMRGYGVADDATIPALSGKRTSFNTVNYAELAWNGRQSVNRLFEYENKIKPGDIIIFYDGGGDAIYSCYPNMVGANARQNQINEALNAVAYGERSYKRGINTFVQNTYTFAAYNKFLKKAIDSPPAPSSSCEKSEIAQAAADFLIHSWEIAGQIAGKRGARFACILQPTPYMGSAASGTGRALPRNHESLSIRSVYPMVKQKAANLPCFVDLSDSLGDEVFFDFHGHATREGNNKIVDLLIDKILNDKQAQ